jgi:putative spermidine/putrescine transport system ATP-binding protein
VFALDEPLSALDAEVRVVLRGEIRRIQTKLKITTIYVTHDQEEALSISDRVVVMNKAHIEQVGTPQEIYREPKTKFVATFIGTANEFHGSVCGKDSGKSAEFLIKTNNASLFADGDEVFALVRPEKIDVYSYTPENIDGNVLEGLVDTITFRGAETRLGIDIGEKVINADVPGKDVFSYGQRVWVAFDSNACQVLK